MDNADDMLSDRKVHGEIGFGVGTNGGRAAFGAAVVPLGDNGVAAFSYDYSRFGRERRSDRDPLSDRDR